MSSSPLSRSNPAIHVSGSPPSKPGTPSRPDQPAYKRPNEYPTPNSYTNYSSYSNSASPSRVHAGAPGPMMASPARPRLRPALDKRESLLRASILDTALELGVGQGGAVERWMFGAIGEEDEDESTVSPSLTYASTATSDESWLHSSTSSSQASPLPISNGKSLMSAEQHLGQRTVQFAPTVFPPENPAVPVNDWGYKETKPQKNGKKLRKVKPDDGYTSDGAGYQSDGGKGKSKKKDKKKDKGDESDGGYLSDVLSRRKKKKEKIPDVPKLRTLNTDLDGDETDGGYLSSSGMGSFVRSRKTSTSKAKGKKSKDGAADEDSDGGYLSSASKKRGFFRRKGKKQSEDDPQRSSADSRTRPIVPPVPALPTMPLPIADRFRSDTPTSNSLDLPASMYTASSRAGTPMSNMRMSESSEQRSSGDSYPPGTPLVSTTPSPMTPPSSSRTLPPPSPSYLSVNSSSNSMHSLESPRALTSAFKDAESVRSPSIDVLKAFGRQAGLNAMSGASAGASAASLQSFASTASYGTVIGHTPGSSQDSANAHTPDMYARSPTEGVPRMSAPKPKMKRTLSQKRTPMPIMGNKTSSMTFSALGVRSIEALREGTDEEDEEESVEYADAGEQVLVVTPATPGSDKTRMSSALGPPSPSTSTRSPSPKPLILTSPITRPTALGKFDIPPPSPPPSGPLPQPPGAPPSPSREAQSPQRDRWSNSADGHRPPPSPLSKSAFAADMNAVATSTPIGKRDRVIRPGTAPSSPGQPAPSSPPATATLTTFPRSPMGASFASRPGTAPTLTSSNAPTTPTGYTGAPGAPPLFLHRIPSNSASIQRGREAPFPARPVVSVSRSGSPLPPARAPSPMHMLPPPPPASAGPVLDGTRFRQSPVNGAHRHFDSEGQGQPQRLDAHWQPRSASALDTRRRPKRNSADYEFTDKRSWVDFDDDSRPNSDAEDMEEDAPGAALAYRKSQRSVYSAQGDESDSDGADRVDDPRGPETEYYTSGSAFPSDAEDDNNMVYAGAGVGSVRRPPMPPIPQDEDSRLSAFTEFDDADYEEGDRKSRVSIMDGNRSGNVREKLVRRVEAMQREAR